MHKDDFINENKETWQIQTKDNAKVSSESLDNVSPAHEFRRDVYLFRVENDKIPSVLPNEAIQGDIAKSNDTLFTNSQHENSDNIDTIMLDGINDKQKSSFSDSHYMPNTLTLKPFSKLQNKKRQLQKKNEELQQNQSLVALSDEDLTEEAKSLKAWRLFIVFSIFILCFFIFILAVYAKVIATPPNMDPYNKQSRNYPWSYKTDTDIAMRGEILSADNYILASSNKFYKINIYVPSIYENKRDAFMKLLNLYAKFDRNALNQAFAKGGNATIADGITSIDASNLRLLNQKMARLGFYKKCTFVYINKTSLEDSEFKTMIAHAEVATEQGRQTTLDNNILKTIKDFKEGNISEIEVLQKLNIALVEYKNKTIDLSQECYTPIFTYNSDVKDNSSTRIDRGLDIAVNQIERKYPFNDIMQPLLGFTNYGKRIIEGKAYDDTMSLVAQSGIEKYRDGILSAKRDGKVTGQADKSGNIVFNKHAKIITREDGFNIKVSIPLVLQAKIQKILEDSNKQYKAQQIVAGIMNPNTGEILTLASSSSFNPNIGERDSDIANKMRVAAAERSFEPGSTIKPLVFSYLVAHKMVNFKEIIDLHDGIYQLRTYTIRDSSPLKSATPEQVIIKSSNIGMTYLTKKLGGEEMQQLFKSFGVGESTGVDIANEATGLLPKSSTLNGEVQKGAASYGYGLRMTFIQLLRSYATFNNGGFLVTPHITKEFISPDSKIFYPMLEAPKRIFDEKTANYMQQLLHRVVKEGTAKRADVDGLVIGGKTGTAREHNQGETMYNGSFFGYASDGKQIYTIGVVTYGSQANEDYYAAQTAVPVFAKIVELLAQEGYLQKKLK